MLRTQPGERERVRADMALQVHPPTATDVSQPWEVEANDIAEELRIVDELLHGIARRSRVSGCSLVPVGAIYVRVAIHDANLLSRTPRNRLSHDD